ncbi:MAG TPA: DMT family transporter [Burkholderiales bacterium]|jgi:drug/metabolite transporter (DMT)-like permease|nr:DMT family transporter [Burkholderiales bacterium]
MTGFALTLILVAAFIHASWNYLLKRSGGGNAFVWLFAVLSAVLYAPLAVAVVWWTQPALGWMSLALMLASAILHTAYFMLLDRGYRSGGDLSLVYPLARGSGPLITVVVAVLLLGENPSGIALAGAALTACGVVLLTGNLSHLRERGSLLAVTYALLTGCVIASYTVVDKLAVAAFAVPPILQDWAANVGRVALMTPLALRAPDEIAATWRRARKEIIAVAILCPLSYILVLTAMVFTPVSYVAPAREVSILIAAVMGAQLLKEGETGRRMIAASAMVAGIVCLAVG